MRKMLSAIIIAGLLSGILLLAGCIVVPFGWVPWNLSFIWGPFALALYFLPTIIGALRRKQNLVGIFLLNLLLGWTLVGWIIALVMASSGDH